MSGMRSGSLGALSYNQVFAEVNTIGLTILVYMAHMLIYTCLSLLFKRLISVLKVTSHR